MEWFQEIHLGCIMWLLGLSGIIGCYLDNRAEAKQVVKHQQEKLSENQPELFNGQKIDGLNPLP